MICPDRKITGVQSQPNTVVMGGRAAGTGAGIKSVAHGMIAAFLNRWPGPLQSPCPYLRADHFSSGAFGPGFQYHDPLSSLCEASRQGQARCPRAYDDGIRGGRLHQRVSGGM